MYRRTNPMKTQKLWHTFAALAIFAAAMGMLEAVVVVYLRALYYPSGFSFPLTTISTPMYSVEIVREFATIVMLVAVAFIAGGSAKLRFAWFLYVFGVWDIIYYTGLKLMLDWPDSLLTWDILFLIPVIWVGPVLAPCICALTMVGFGSGIVYLQQCGFRAAMGMSHWALVLCGSAVIIYCFTVDFSMLIVKGGFLGDILNLATNQQFIQASAQYVPQRFAWVWFWIGELLILAGISRMAIDSVRMKNLHPQTAQ